MLCTYSKSKWTTLATVGREIIEDADGVSINKQAKKLNKNKIKNTNCIFLSLQNIIMPHQVSDYRNV